jgi:holo-[acyl-carrier protein] synthase
MISGIGIDTVEIARFQGFLDKKNQPLLDRLFTHSEQQHCVARKQAASCLAARFAAKEALLKALGTGLRDGVSWLDIEVTNDELGKPSLMLFGKAEELLRNMRLAAPHLSLSHDGGNAVAVVVLETL